MFKYVILKVENGYMCVSKWLYLYNVHLKGYEIVDIGTKRKLRKYWNI